MCECLRVLVCKCVSVWVCECVSVWVCDCVSVLVCECVCEGINHLMISIPLKQCYQPWIKKLIKRYFSSLSLFIFQIKLFNKSWTCFFLLIKVIFATVWHWWIESCIGWLYRKYIDLFSLNDIFQKVFGFVTYE